MTAATLETLVWILIYGGLLAVGLGLAVLRRHATTGGALLVAGGLAVALGAVLIVVRARLREGGE